MIAASSASSTLNVEPVSTVRRVGGQDHFRRLEGERRSLRHGDGVGGHSRVVVLLEGEGGRAGDKDAAGAGRQAAEFVRHIGQGEESNRR